MNRTTIVGVNQPAAHERGSLARALTIWVGLASILALAAGLLIFGSDSSKSAAQSDPVQEELTALAAFSTGERSEIVSEGQSAQERNALIPVSSLPYEGLPGFTAIRSGHVQYAAAHKCLSQAIYYEAANEPLSGKRAVAQVVLNRLRHPAYPNSVCDVVYDGWDKPVCQFSFVCDGSLLKKPMPRQWAESENVAARALSGQTEPLVGTSTHYHADYVLPRWAYQLAKIEKIGVHVFYRFPSHWGRARAFTGRWRGLERVPKIDFARLKATLETSFAEGVNEAPEVVPGLTVPRHISDRHAENDVGGRIDTTKAWRLSIPDPVTASSSYQASLEEQGARALTMLNEKESNFQ